MSPGPGRVSLPHLGTLGPDLCFIQRPHCDEESSEHSSPSPCTPHFGHRLELAPRNHRFLTPIPGAEEGGTGLRGAMQGRHWGPKGAGRAGGKGKRVEQGPAWSRSEALAARDVHYEKPYQLSGSPSCQHLPSASASHHQHLVSVPTSSRSLMPNAAPTLKLLPQRNWAGGR